MSCRHHPPCPDAEASDVQAAVPVASHPGQGWTLLCNGVLCFSDTGLVLPDGHVVAPPHRHTDTGERAA
ncbi:DUF5999 family protein [Kitasatospora sp. NPDC058201]|uniref:DUF5999 family protein n=1 Tax=unclassified Kitasatospora TaxID=2633591 RepID=UPI00365843F3